MGSRVQTFDCTTCLSLVYVPLVYAVCGVCLLFAIKKVVEDKEVAVK